MLLTLMHDVWGNLVAHFRPISYPDLRVFEGVELKIEKVRVRDSRMGGHIARRAEGIRNGRKQRTLHAMNMTRFEDERGV